MNVETASKLVALRKKNGLSQEELAERIGVSRQAISKWERAESSPDTDNLIALAKVYDISIDEMLSGNIREDFSESHSASDVESTSASENKINWKAFPYPVLVTIIYLVLGFIYGLWHPGWLVFLTIPLWAALVGKNKEEEKRTAHRRKARRHYTDNDWMDE